MLAQLLHILQQAPWLFYTTVALAGLSVGSFLNVVAYRLPLMLERDWRKQCRDYLELKADDSEQAQPAISLSKPRSSCPHCGHKIRPWENIPVLSYLFLGGKCSSCKQSISIRYPLVEAITGMLSVVVAMRLGVTVDTLAALFLTWTLIALTLIDLDTQLLPDTITLPLLWTGLLIALFNVFTDVHASVIGAIAGYMVLWTVFQVFRLITGKEGMGFGDFKLLAALGAWLGWSLLPQIILLSSLVGACIGVAMIMLGNHGRQQPIPFGPYLAIAGWIALLWGHDINQLYLSSLQ